MISIKSTLKNVKILHLAFLFTVPLFLLQLHLLHPAEHGVSNTVIFGFGAACLLDIVIASRFRDRMIAPSKELLRANPEDTAALNRWRAGSIISFTYAETIVLFGFALKVLGVGWNIAGIFFVVGILLLLAWTPRLDLPQTL